MSFKKIPEWSKKIDEHEQYISLHRWNWLLRSLTDEVDLADFFGE